MLKFQRVAFKAEIFTFEYYSRNLSQNVEDKITAPWSGLLSPKQRNGLSGHVSVLGFKNSIFILIGNLFITQESSPHLVFLIFCPDFSFP